MRLAVYSLIFFFIASVITSCSLCREINPEDIPLYPNAHDVKQDEPNIGGIDIYKWSFTTTDNPEKVWQFYKDKIVGEWNGSDNSLPRSSEKDVMIEGCSFYYFKLNSSSINDTAYKITLEFSIEPYR